MTASAEESLDDLTQGWIPQDEELTERMDENPDFVSYNPRWRLYPVRFTEASFEANQTFFMGVDSASEEKCQIRAKCNILSEIVILKRGGKMASESETQGLLEATEKTLTPLGLLLFSL